MRLSQCEKCPHLSGEVCLRNGRPISRLNGCSRSPSGRMFFRAKSGEEFYRLNVLGKHKGETK